MALNPIGPATGGMVVSCPSCQGRSTAKEGPYRGRHDIFSGLDLRRCAGCGLVFAHPMPSLLQWEEFNSRFFSDGAISIPEDREVLLFSRGMACLRLHHIEKHSGWTSLPTSVLEIGAGPGFLYREYITREPEVCYAAVETDEGCQRMLRQDGVEVFGRLGDIIETGNKYDLLVMSHVLEHVLDPRAFLRDALRCLRPGGVVFIEVPCMDWEYKLFFNDHVLFFDKHSLGHLLELVGNI